MTQKIRHCETEGCSNTIKAGSETGLCSTCYSYAYYWLKKNSVGAILKHKKRVEKYNTRLDNLLGNVVSINSKQKRKAG